MTIDDLQAVLGSQDELRRALRKPEVCQLLSGNFKVGRVPFVHQVTFPNGGQLRLKFYDVVKKIYNTKGQEVLGKESYLTYLEVTAAPAGEKAYFFTQDVVQAVWAPSKSKATAKYEEARGQLVAFATALGIDLSEPTSWCQVYSQNY